MTSLKQMTTHPIDLCNGRTRVAEVAREHGWHPPKSLDSDENFKPEHTLFCRKLRFVAIYALFWKTWDKMCFVGEKKEFLGKEVRYYMVIIST